MSAVQEPPATEAHDAKHEAPHGAALEFDLPPAAKVSKTRALVLSLVVLAVLAGAFLIAWLPKRQAQHELVATTKASETALIRVEVVTPKSKSSDHAIALAGSVQALEETVVYARASGYVSKWNVDIGDTVKEGDVLVEIDTPEIDQELIQAHAQLVQAQAGLTLATANRDFSSTNLNRYKALTPTGVTSQQELEQHQAQSEVDQANVKVAEAAIAAQQANVHRLSDLKSFARVTAPFGGTINARMIERGALVSPTTGLFKISATDPVRVFVQVPQDIATNVRVDAPAQVTVREYGARIFEGKVSRAAGALDPVTRTMNVEIRIPNPKKELLAGVYVQVALTLPSPHHVLEVPATAVMIDSKGVRVAIVGPDDVLHLVPVIVERDTGSSVELAGGIQETDRVVKLGGADLVEGAKVQIAQ